MGTLAAHRAELPLIEQLRYQTCAARAVMKPNIGRVVFRFTALRPKNRADSLSLAVGEKWKGACLRNGCAVDSNCNSCVVSACCVPLRGDGMFRSLVAILAGFLVLPAFCQNKSNYQPGTIMAVVARPNNSGDDSVPSYDVSVQVGNTLYVVLYTPPLGAGTPQYAAGRELLVKVGDKAVTFNDMLGESHEAPIESSSPAKAPSRQATESESPQAPIKATLVMGWRGIKDNSRGILTIENGNLHFVWSKKVVDIPVASMTDVVADNDSQRVEQGSVGSRSKADRLAIRYRDANGVHSVIFTMEVGQATLLKQQLIAQGAHAAVPNEGSPVHAASKLSPTTEQMP